MTVPDITKPRSNNKKLVICIIATCILAHVRGKKEQLAVKMLLGFRSFKMSTTLKIISTKPKSLEFNILCFAVMLKPTCTYR